MPSLPAHRLSLSVEGSPPRRSPSLRRSPSPRPPSTSQRPLSPRPSSTSGPGASWPAGSRGLRFGREGIRVLKLVLNKVIALFLYHCSLFFCFISIDSFSLACGMETAPRIRTDSLSAMLETWTVFAPFGCEQLQQKFFRNDGVSELYLTVWSRPRHPS